MPNTYNLQTIFQRDSTCPVQSWNRQHLPHRVAQGHPSDRPAATFIL
jgi:hypothetical protein